jgi:HEPN domain-containing protein
MKKEENVTHTRDEIKYKWFANATCCLNEAIASKTVALDGSLTKICYTAHLSIESSLKAYLREYYDFDFKSHNLLKICEKCAKESGDHTILSLRDLYIDLESFEILSRYPHALNNEDIDCRFTLADANNAIYAAQKTYEFVKAHVFEDWEMEKVNYWKDVFDRHHALATEIIMNCRNPHVEAFHGRMH